MSKCVCINNFHIYEDDFIFESGDVFYYVIDDGNNSMFKYILSIDGVFHYSTDIPLYEKEFLENFKDLIENRDKIIGEIINE